MALQTSGQITLSQVQSEFGGSNPIHLTEYYRNNGLVPSTISTTTAVPAGAYNTATGSIGGTQYWSTVGTVNSASTNLHTLRYGNVQITGLTGTTTTTTFAGVYQYTRGQILGTTGGGWQGPIVTWYKVKRRTAATTTTTTTTVNSSIPPNGQITLKNMYGGRKT